jgi:alkanesulfonate monooxygenase SsuD/methylene tetrahydromethanopterin reductase-like flavin-dependent oxidoreductase (luciferase family)
MELGYFNVLPQRDGAKRPRQAVAESLEQIKLAEDAGYHVAWFTEHHYTNFSLVPSPHLLAAYLMPQTKRIKFGGGVHVLPLYNPGRFAEEIAFLDDITEGRFVLGLGVGFQDLEFTRLGLSLADARPRFHEALDILERALTQESFDYDGRFYKMPASYLAYRPKAMVPVTIAGGPDDADLQGRMARKGYTPFISGQWKTAKEMAAQRARIAHHRAAAGFPSNTFPLAINRFIHVTESRSEALAAAEHLRYSYRIAHNLRTPRYETDRHVVLDRPAQGEPDIETIAQNAIIGGWEKCAEQVTEELRLMQPSHLSCVMQFGGMPHAGAMASLERFVGQVLPAVRRTLGDLDGIGAVPGARAAE